MNAVVCPRYGGPEVLRLAELPDPVPGDDEVRIRVKAAGVAAGDWHLLRGTPFIVRLMFGLRAPKFPVLGSDVSGVVEAVGKDVTAFRPGDEVFGDLSSARMGAFAEVACAPWRSFVRKPASLSWVEAAVLPVSAQTALQGLREVGGLRAGQTVLVNGASGGVGHYAVQIAKSVGATVTGVCSARNQEMVREVGADEVLDYRKEDFTRSGRQWDLILDCAAFRSPQDCLPAVAPGGSYVLVGGHFRRTMQVMAFGRWMGRRSGKRVLTYINAPTPAKLQAVADLAAAGTLRPVVDRTFPLEDTPKAVAWVEEGRGRGKVGIEVAPLPN